MYLHFIIIDFTNLLNTVPNIQATIGIKYLNASYQLPSAILIPNLDILAVCIFANILFLVI